MGDKKYRPDFTQWGFSLVVGVSVSVMLWAIGQIASEFASGAKDLDLIIPFPVSLLLKVRMWWMLTAGFLALLIVMAKDWVMPRKRSAMVNTFVFFFTLSLSGFLVYMMAFKLYSVAG